ncbi:MAG: SDR family NAD(P)-dependent oxidoreductase [Candidatus Hydrogenedentes bacterium]|nr:SDR family NAD(P)-dependent oxidoreductase [Candidatus Hydrogenedentota bacterium]
MHLEDGAKNPGVQALRQWLVNRVARETRMEPSHVGIHTPFASFGLGSAQAVSLAGELEEMLGREMPATLAWEYPTIAELADYLARDPSGSAPRSADDEDFPPLEPIAIVGIACRLPGATGPHAFWNMLCQGREAIVEVPPDRWDVEEYYDPTPGTPGKTYARWGGFIDKIDLFDPGFFGISPREATRMDPQQRILLELAWNAIEDAGIDPDTLHGSRTGVFVGITGNDYGRVQMNPAYTDMYMPTGNATSIAANRVSYFFNLRGPSMIVDTACSSSLVALHLACKSLWNREADAALAGGTNLLLSPTLTINLSLAGMLSKEGRCKAFDASADGFVRGEGAGFVVLKPLARALADGDAIYATVLATSVNSDGRSNGITAPSREAQEAALRDACRRAGIPPATIDYVEAHGTGTVLGDPIEASAIGTVLGVGRDPERPILLGSVKTNIGHLEGAAGIAGIIKAALCIKHRQIPPSLHFKNPNPNIPFDRLPLRVQTQLSPWPAWSEGAVAGVSSFGFGGTNACAILGEAPQQAPRTSASPSPFPHLLVLSAHDQKTLPAVAEVYADFLRSGDNQGIPPEDICYTAALHRKHFPQRLAVTGRDREDLASGIEAFINGAARANVCVGAAVTDRRPHVAFVFPGQGTQWPGMGRRLLECSPVFREAVEEVDALFHPLGSWSILEEMARPAQESRLEETACAQPVLFALQTGLAAMWKSWGVEPDSVLGHSMGEAAAAFVAGALSLDDAVQVIHHRSRLMQRATGTGQMVSVSLPLEEVKTRLAAYGGRIGIGAVNSPTSVVVSGESDAVDELLEELTRDRAAFQSIARHYAFHSHLMDPFVSELEDALAAISPRAPAIPIYSTVTGARIDVHTSLDASYWGRNLRQTVLFHPAVDATIGDGVHVLLECSPHPTLRGPARQCIRSRGAKAVTVESLRKDEDDGAAVIQALGALHVAGFALDYRTVFPGVGKRVALPTYPWQRQRCWLELGEADMWQGAWKGASSRGAHPFKPRKTDAPTPTWQFDLDMQALAFLREHQVQGSPILPATAFLEMALVAANAHFGSSGAILSDVTLFRPLGLTEGKQETHVVFDSASPSEVSFQLYSRHASKGASATWTLHASGSAAAPSAGGNGRAHRLTEDRAAALRRGDTVTSGPFYDALRARGYEYGPSFQGVEAVWRNNGEALGRLRPAAAHGTGSQPYEVHPAVLDSAMQVLGAALASQPDRTGANAVYLPVHFDEVLVHEKQGAPSWAHVTLRKHEGNGPQVEGDVTLYSPEYRPVVELRGLRLQRVENKDGERSRDAGNPADWLFEIVWEPKPAPGTRGTVLPGAVPALRAFVDEVEKEAHTQNEVHAMRRYEAAVGLLDALVAAYTVNTMLELGWHWAPGETFAFEAMCAHLGIAPRHKRVVNRLLEMLEEDGLLARAGDEWRAVAELKPQDADALYRHVLAGYPSLAAELAICGACGQQLGAILTGQKDALAVIFPEGSFALVERLYADSPFSRANNALVKRALTRIVESLPPGRVLRILEVGAGTGGLTSHILPVLPSDRVKYTFTDVSPLFLGQAEAKFRTYSSLVEYRLLDVEASPESQGFDELHAFDIVIAANVLHATSDLRISLEHVKSLLAPRGLLMLIEGAGKRRLLDLVFGLTEGWWRFKDFDVRPAHPLISGQAWRRLLAELGFVDSFDSEACSEGSRISQQPVLMAEAPALDAPSVALQSLHPKEEAGLWVLLADSTGVADRLAEDLKSLGEGVATVYPAAAYEQRAEGVYGAAPQSPEDLDRVLRHVGECANVVRGVVHCWSLDAAPLQKSAGDPSAVSQNCASALAIFKALTAIQHRPAPRLYLVTRGSQPVRLGDPACDPAQATLWGLAKVMTFENAALRCTAIDLEAEQAEGCASLLLREVWHGDAESLVAFREGARYVQRMTAWCPTPSGLATDGETAMRLEIARPGSIDGVAVRPARRATPGPDEVEIAVKASALNFRDILKAAGMYPTREGEYQGLGDECCGVVVSAGANVQRFKAGDNVVAIARDSFATSVIAHQNLVVPKPENLTYEEAAGVPVVFLTALYALCECARLQRGERVLIHAGAGGVGLAAIQVAQWLGAEVFATAGSPEKREYLEALGVPHVMDSRTLKFADEIDAITEGRGVDVVLNSLAGKALLQSVACLASFGRFIEIGKRDIYENLQLGLRPFSKTLTFTSLDLGRAIEHVPDTVKRLLEDIVSLLDEGVLKALPARVYPLSEVHAAFRHMAQARHIGKIVLTLRDGALACTTWRKPAIRSDATYLITGAFGGFGGEVATWLADCGARHLALMSRSGASGQRAQSLVRELTNRGVNTCIVQGDVARGEDVRNAIAQIQDGMPPLRGVFHAAMVIDDESLTAMTLDKMERVLAPKVRGAWNLHQQTRNAPLDYFVLFSSGAALAGSPGQGNYVAANAYLDALAHHRRALGMPGLSVNWGRIADVGYVAEHQDVADRLTRLGFEGIAPREALSILSELMASGAVQTGVVRNDWNKWRDFYPAGEDFPLIGRLVSKERREDGGGSGLNLEALRGSADREAALRLYLCECLGQVLALEPESLDVDKSLDALGLDSIAGMELKSKIESDFSLSLPMAMLVQGPTVAQFASDLLKLILDTHGLPAPPAVSAAAGGHVEHEEGEI